MGDAAAVSAAGAVGYLLGTFPTAVVVTRLVTRNRVDIRRAGSGNPGGFNTFREVSKVWGAAVILVDATKAALAGLLALWLVGDTAAFVAAAAAIAGHNWPVWSHFRGGKGVAAAGGAVLGIFPAGFPVVIGALAVAAVVLRDARRAMLAGMAAWVLAAGAWSIGGWGNLWGPRPGWGLVAFAGVGAAMVVVKFRTVAAATAPPVTRGSSARRDP